MTQPEDPREPAPDLREARLPPLPQCTYLVDQEAKRHGMYPAYRSLQNVMKYGGESTFEMMFSADDMRAYARAALALPVHQSPTPNPSFPPEPSASGEKPEAVGEVRWPDAPPRIYLQVCADGEHCDQSYAWHRREASDGDGMTWCEDKINVTDVKYVRADLAETQPTSHTARSDETESGLLRPTLGDRE